MPCLKNARHEAFAQGLAKGLTADEAYTKAGFKPHRGNASTLRANQIILDRVEELVGKAAKKVEISIESLAGELEEARTIAIAEKQSSAAVSATMGKAKLFGLGVEKRHVSGTIQVINITAKQLEALTDDELVKLEEAYPILQKLGLISAGNTSGETGEGGE
jgi:hypothetical protein